MKKNPPKNIPNGPGDVLQNSHDVACVLGGVSSMTIWRHIKVGVLPPPIKLRGRNYWWRSAVAAVAMGDQEPGSASVMPAGMGHK